MSTLDDYESARDKLVHSLTSRSQSGGIELLSEPLDPNFIYCFISLPGQKTELILFEIQYPSRDGGVSDGSPESIIARVRNQVLIWLPLLDGFKELHEVLRGATENSSRIKVLQRGILDDFIGELTAAS